MGSTSWTRLQARLYVPSTLWRMKNESLSYFASKIFDFFKPLPPLPPTPPDTLDLSICYGSLIALACMSVYCGSIGSLPYHQRHKDKDDKGGYDDSDEEDEVLEEKITTDDAWLFPILGSCMLFGLYLLLRYLGPEWVNEILRYWFAFMSWGAVFKVICALDIQYVHITDYYLTRRVIPSQGSPLANNDGKLARATPSMPPARLIIHHKHHPILLLLNRPPPRYSL